MNVLVVGASRGIGLEFVRQHRAAGDHVLATARDQAALARLAALGAQAIHLDVADAASCASLAGAIDGLALQRVVYAAGVLQSRTRGLDPPSQAEFDTVMHANVLGAMRVLPQVAMRLAPNAVVAVISSDMASIAARRSAGAWLYRASKAALNSVLKDTSLVLGERAICVALSPGWVRTDMGGAAAPLDVADSVRDLRTLLARLTPAETGGYFNHDGRPIAW